MSGDGGDASSTGRPRIPRTVRYPLERGWTRRRLIRELAQMEKTPAQLSREYGVSRSAMTQFAARHKREIGEVKADIENAFAGLWIAQKEARLAEYQEDAERLSESDDPELLKIKHGVLRAVAEEVGQIPSKVNINVGNRQVTYVIAGVDLDALK
jgi:hypothetical protein